MNHNSFNLIEILQKMNRNRMQISSLKQINHIRFAPIVSGTVDYAGVGCTVDKIGPGVQTWTQASTERRRPGFHPRTLLTDVEGLETEARSSVVERPTRRGENVDVLWKPVWTIFSNVLST